MSGARLPRHFHGHARRVAVAQPPPPVHRRSLSRSLITPRALGHRPPYTFYSPARNPGRDRAAHRRGRRRCGVRGQRNAVDSILLLLTLPPALRALPAVPFSGLFSLSTSRSFWSVFHGVRLTEGNPGNSHDKRTVYQVVVIRWEIIEEWLGYVCVEIGRE